MCGVAVNPVSSTKMLRLSTSQVSSVASSDVSSHVFQLSFSGVLPEISTILREVPVEMYVLHFVAHCVSTARSEPKSKNISQQVASDINYVKNGYYRTRL